MRYVAEPYHIIADQVLTALTGGLTREAHRFFPGANGFSFALPSSQVLPESIRVVGQTNQAFTVFQKDRDFVLDRDGLLRFRQDPKNKTQPAAGVTWPDEGSEFFVSYYHAKSGQALLTDRNVGSVSRTLGEAFARELAVLRQQLELVYLSGFVESAEATSLDMVVALLGVSRRSRQYAVGAARFFRDTPAPADIFIPEGTKVSTATNPPVSFITTVGKTLRRGQLSVDADIRAEVAGPSGVVAAATIRVINQTILGISGVTNEAPTVFGGAPESDPELRSRAKKAIERAGKATPRAILNMVTEQAGLKENDIRVTEDLVLRPGVVQLFVANDLPESAAARVQEAILASRPAGIRVEHNLAIVRPTSPAEFLPRDPARDEDVTTEPAPTQDFTMPLVGDVLVFPENPRITGGEQVTLERAVRAAVLSYIDASAIGGFLIYNQIVADVMAMPGVLDVVLVLQPKADPSSPGKRNIDVPEGRRAKLADADLTVRFAGAPVNFDFFIKVAGKSGAPVATILADIRREIRTKLAEYFSTNPQTITSTDLMSRLSASDLYAINADDLAWAAEYDQAGLTIREQGGPGASTTIAAGDRPVLRDVRVEERGA